jgi:hypothetical protein
MPQFEFIRTPPKPDVDKSRQAALESLKDSVTWQFIVSNVIEPEMEARLEAILTGGEGADTHREVYKFLKFFKEFPERELAQCVNKS